MLQDLINRMRNLHQIVRTCSYHKFTTGMHNGEQHLVSLIFYISFWIQESKNPPCSATSKIDDFWAYQDKIKMATFLENCMKLIHLATYLYYYLHHLYVVKGLPHRYLGPHMSPRLTTCSWSLASHALLAISGSLPSHPAVPVF